MANTSSAKKMVRKIARRTAVNKARRTALRNVVRTLEESLAQGDKAKAQEALKHAQPALAKAVKKGVLPKNTASRKVARLTRRVNGL